MIINALKCSYTVTKANKTCSLFLCQILSLQMRRIGGVAFDRDRERLESLHGIEYYY